MDKRGEVAGLSVESAAGIQTRRPPIQQTAISTSWRFWDLEKSKDRSKASVSSTLGGQCKRLNNLDREEWHLL